MLELSEVESIGLCTIAVGRGSVGVVAARQPAVMGIQLAEGAVGTKALLHGFANEQCYIVGCLGHALEMTATGIAEKRDTTPGIHHAKGESRANAGFPPLILTLYHQAGNAINVAGSTPLHIGRAVTTQIGARRIAVERDDTKRTLIVPCGKVPGHRGLRRMAERNDGHCCQLSMSALSGQPGHHLVEHFLAPRTRIPTHRKPGGYPDEGNVHLFHVALEGGHLEKHLLGHILLGKHHCLHLPASLGNPQIGCRSLARLIGDVACHLYRILIHATRPYSTADGGNKSQKAEQEKVLLFHDATCVIWFSQSAKQRHH